MLVHPQHDLIAAEVRSWYTDWSGATAGGDTAGQQMDVQTERCAFGYLRRGPGAVRRLVLTVDDAGELPGAVDAGARFFGTADFEVWCDEKDRAAALEPALGSVGFLPAETTSVLALVGTLDAADGPPALEVAEVVDATTLSVWARVKLQGFSDSEEEPSDGRLAAEIAARLAEWPISRYDLAFLGGEAVGALAHYTASPDQMVFALATRVPFRHRRIAQSMLQRWVSRGVAQAARSLLINCEANGRPAALYRRMGFTDEVYWHRRYQRGLT